jgi:hypothetical protein
LKELEGELEKVELPFLILHGSEVRSNKNTPLNNLCYCPRITSDAQSATQVSSVAGLVTLDAVTATQVLYSASSVAKRIVGSFLVTEKIYSDASLVWCSNQIHYFELQHLNKNLIFGNF